MPVWLPEATFFRIRLIQVLPPGSSVGQGVAIDCEPVVLSRVFQVVPLVEPPGPGASGRFQLGRTLSGDSPGRRVVNGFAVDLEPLAHAEQKSSGLVRNGAVRLRTYVEEKVSVFADTVHQVVA